MFIPIRVTCPTHPVHLDLIHRLTFGRSAYCEDPHYPVNSSLFGPDIFFLKAIVLCSSLNVTQQFSHSYDTGGKITFICFGIVRGKMEYSVPNGSKLSPNLLSS